MEFRILGPLEVAAGDELLALGGSKQRALLAILLLHANEVVSSDRLIEGLWSERPPESGRKVLQVRVSQLRKALGTAGRQLLTRPPGYVLRVDREQLDLYRFERLVSEAEAAQPAIAADKLREALGLWRGAPLDDVAYESFAQAEIGRLQELRIAAIEKWIEADLALGRHAQVIAELESVAAEHPLRERVACQLMLALYRSGRQADALDAYQRVRVRLDAELGLEPGPELVALQSAILSHDPSLGSPHSSIPVAPSRLPVQATAFLGRARELVEVRTLLRTSGTRLLTLTGAGGTGKTRLALRVAEGCAGDYRDGARFVSLANTVDPGLIAATMIQALGLADEPGLSPVQRLEAWLKDREVLLLLDNVEQLAQDTSMLGELLAVCPGVTVLATSREPLHLAGERQYDVPVLVGEEAVALFSARAESVAAARNIDAAVAGAICDRLDCLPLAIELAAARIKAFSATEILGRLDSRLALLTSGPRDAPRRQRTLRATIDWSYELLSPEERLLFARLSVFAGGCTLAAAEAVCEARLDALHGLVDRSLVQCDRERYWMLETLREYALERLEGDGDVGELRRAHANWLIELLDAEGLPQPGWPTARSLAHVAPERDNFEAALEWASRNVMAETVARLAAPLVGVWIQTGRLYEADRWITVALEQEDAYPALLAAQVLSAARALSWNRGDHAQAGELTQRALARWRDVGDLEAIATEMVSLGMIACEEGDLVGGRAAYERAIQFAREHALMNVLAVALIDLGDLEIQEGDLEAGRVLSEESRTVAASESDSAVFARINLAHIAMLERRPADAARLGREMIEATLATGSVLKLAWSAMQVAWPLAELGELERSARLLGSGVEFLESCGAKLEWMDEGADAAVKEILRAQLDEQTVQGLLDEGRRTSVEETCREALRESAALAGSRRVSRTPSKDR
jgi:predicted ATPase/DNA-binding SARP family transcriptional activator